HVVAGAVVARERALGLEPGEEGERQADEAGGAERGARGELHALPSYLTRVPGSTSPATVTSESPSVEAATRIVPSETRPLPKSLGERLQQTTTRCPASCSGANESPRPAKTRRGPDSPTSTASSSRPSLRATRSTESTRPTRMSRRTNASSAPFSEAGGRTAPEALVSVVCSSGPGGGGGTLCAMGLWSSRSRRLEPGVDGSAEAGGLSGVARSSSRAGAGRGLPVFCGVTAPRSTPASPEGTSTRF